MQGSSRGALVAGHDALAAALRSGQDWSVLAEDLFGVSATLDSSASLRRALADPSRDAAARRGLAAALFGGRVGEAAAEVLAALASQRWSQERDLADTVEELAVETVLASAEAGGRLDALEDELFRFGRVVAGSPDLREAVTDRHAEGSAKAGLVDVLLRDKTGTETIRLARQAVLAPRGRRFDRIIERYLTLAARRREQLTATVLAATPLDEEQRHRLAAALGGIYERTVQVNVVLDPEVIGGLRVQVGDEVVDGTILARLEDARRRLAG